MSHQVVVMRPQLWSLDDNALIEFMFHGSNVKATSEGWEEGYPDQLTHSSFQNKLVRVSD